MQWLRLGADADYRPGIAGPRIGLAVPQLAVETDAAKLAGDRQAAQKHFRGLLKVAERGDKPGRQELAEARSEMKAE